MVGALVMLDRIVSPLLRTLAETLGRQVDRYLQERVMAAVGRPATVAHLEDSEVLARLRVVRGLGTADSDRPGLAVEAMAAVLPSWLRALGAAAVLLAFHPAVGLLWLVVWPAVVHVMQREYLRVGQVGFGQSDALRRAEYLRDLAITAPAAKEIRIWGMLDWLLGRYRSAWRAAVEPIWRQRRPRRGAVLGTTGTIVAVNALSYGLLVWAAVRGTWAWPLSRSTPRPWAWPTATPRSTTTTRSCRSRRSPCPRCSTWTTDSPPGPMRPVPYPRRPRRRPTPPGSRYGRCRRSFPPGGSAPRASGSAIRARPRTRSAISTSPSTRASRSPSSARTVPARRRW
ncbi:hypothetical protein [Micromonospora zhanjiangensis]